ncbi:MAG: radical SAM protein [Elusimicrobia bacterium]|nr:radical SAM protein [Elusimicrobiota bacterium]
MRLEDSVARCASLLAEAERLLAERAPDGGDEAALRLETLDDALLAAWTAAERARPASRAAAARLEDFLFYRRGLLRRLARSGVRVGPGLLASLFRGSAGRRMFVFVTHACQLRCSYCHVAKDSRRMPDEVVDAGVRLMLRSLRSEVEFHFFGGEPMLAFDAVRRATLLARRLGARAGKTTRFLLTTNGLDLGDDELLFLQEHRFSLEFSCDGARDAQLAQRATAGKGDYYARLSANLARLRGAGVPYVVITVVMPGDAGSLLERFRYLAGLGHRRIQVNYALGSLWDEASRAEFFRQMSEAARWARGEGIEFVNLTASRREPVILNGDLTLDCDGSLFRGPVLFDGALTRSSDGRPLGARSEAARSRSYREVQRLFRADRVERALLPDYYGATPFDNFVSLCRAYRSRPRARAVVLDNVEMGLLSRGLPAL